VIADAEAGALCVTSSPFGEGLGGSSKASMPFVGVGSSSWISRQGANGCFCRVTEPLKVPPRQPDHRSPRRRSHALTRSSGPWSFKGSKAGVVSRICNSHSKVASGGVLVSSGAVESLDLDLVETVVDVATQNRVYYCQVDPTSMRRLPPPCINSGLSRTSQSRKRSTR